MWQVERESRRSFLANINKDLVNWRGAFELQYEADMRLICQSRPLVLSTDVDLGMDQVIFVSQFKARSTPAT